ncbi:SRPBCC family protein [Actinomycetaceae bacterium L2_0104]
MPITNVEKDLEAVTLTITAEFNVPLRRLWDAYADPRQLEKFWGPPGWPATFSRHDFAPGGLSNYYMTGPDGETSGGYWEFISVDAPRSFEVRDGFALPDGTPNTEMPSMRMVFSFEAAGSGSKMTTTTYFNSAKDLEELLAMGMLEGTQAAMGQIDEVLADLTSFAQGRGTEAQILSDTKVRISRIIRGDVEQVWRAHHEPELVRRWMLGPDGWTMPVCEIAEKVGDGYTYEWESDEGTDRFGFAGRLVESAAPHREVTTEQMIGTEGPSTLNEMTLTPVEGGTLLSIVITYPDAEVRDAILATGMTDGMEASYARLENTVLS